MSSYRKIPILFYGKPGLRYSRHPVQMGIPLPRGSGAGIVKDLEQIRLHTRSGEEIPRDITPLLQAPDGAGAPEGAGHQWVLLRFLADWKNDDPSPYYLSISDLAPQPCAKTKEKRKPSSPLSYKETEDGLQIRTGILDVTLDGGAFFPFRQVTALDTPLLSTGFRSLEMTDATGIQYGFSVDTLRVEHCGEVNLRVWAQGAFVAASAPGKSLCRAAARLDFFADSGLVGLECTLWNPEAASHPGGLWDMGGKGSIFFKSVEFALAFSPRPGPVTEGNCQYYYQAELGRASDGDFAWNKADGDLTILQNSSGKENWQSRAHVDKDNRPTTRFRGYRISQGLKTVEGLQANPVLLGKTKTDKAALSQALAMEHFWETFPSSLEIRGDKMVASPFPKADGQLFELQGGEKTTFRIWMDFACRDGHDIPEGKDEAPALLSARAPLSASLEPRWYADLGRDPGHGGAQNGETSFAPFLAYLSPDSSSDDGFFRALAKQALCGPDDFAVRRDAFDEYGWRNFGEVPADHEARHYPGQWPLVSHYNNQYDLIQSFLLHFLRDGQPRWMEWAKDLCRHVMNHDLYHTSKDRSVFNGGYFWHTCHYMHAGTATHRAYSRLALEGKPLPGGFGGGPSNEHDYSSGMALYYLLTGDPNAKDAVLQLAEWVKNLQDGSKTVFRFLARGQTGLATCTRHLDFQGPGRGAGYSINTCLDAFVLSGQAEYLERAEKFLQICIHPDDNPAEMDLLNREDRWSYVVFLQVLGKYLDVKSDRGGRDLHSDYAFHYARSSLLRYAEWMALYEYPYLDKPEELEYPTSTWAAQDLRKSHVFLLAAKYGKIEARPLFLKKAEEFFAKSRAYLEKADDALCSRNLALILGHVPVHYYFRENPPSFAAIKEPSFDFGKKKILIPQKIVAMKRAKLLIVAGGATFCAALLYFLLSRF